MEGFGWTQAVKNQKEAGFSSSKQLVKSWHVLDLLGELTVDTLGKCPEDRMKRTVVVL